jgi:hypothetical protein
MCIICFLLGYFVADVISKCGFGREHMSEIQVGNPGRGIEPGTGDHESDQQPRPPKVPHWTRPTDGSKRQERCSYEYGPGGNYKTWTCK